MNNLFTKSILAASIAVSAGAVNAAMLEEIVVTAQQRSESLQDVPVSVAAVTAEKMSNAGIVDLQGLSELVPNFSINETGISTTVTIRGISSGINPGFEQSVGIYNDGIFYGRDQLARIPMMDMERVEILRGPQGILFGKNSIAGAVSQVSAKPTDDFQGSVTALYEPDHGEQDVRVVLSANLKVSRSTFDTVGRNMEVYNSIGAPDHISVLNGIPSTAVASPVEAGLNYSADNNGHFSDNEVSDVTLTVDWDMDGFSLTSVTGFVEYEFDENCDCDFSGAAIFDAARQEEYEQFSQEFRFTSDLGGDFDYIGGLFFQSTELNYKDQISLPSPTLIGDVLAGLAPSLAPFAPGASTDRSFNQEGDLWAVFAQGTYTLTDEVRVTVGGRYTSETKDADRTQQHKAVAAFGGQYQPAVVADPISGAYNALWGIFAIEPYQTIVGKLDDSSFTPVVTVEWDANEDTMAYFTWTKGFKSGGFDARSNGHPDAAVNNAGNPISGNPITGSWVFDREEATSIELGSKMTLADGAAELNIALYMTEYSDLQVSQFDGTLGFNVTNAGEATVQGLEADGRWAVSDNVTLTGSAAYLDFNYDKFPNSQCYFGQVSDSADFAGLCDVSGERKEYTPELQANIGAAWMGEVGEGLILSASADLVYMDDYIYASNLDPRTMQKATTQVSARIAISDSEGNWEVALLGRNLTDETVINFGGNTPLGGTLTGGAGNSYYAFVNRPLNIALQAKYSF